MSATSDGDNNEVVTDMSLPQNVTESLQRSPPLARVPQPQGSPSVRRSPSSGNQQTLADFFIGRRRSGGGAEEPRATSGNLGPVPPLPVFILDDHTRVMPPIHAISTFNNMVI